MRDKPLSLVLIVLAFAIFSLAGCVLRHDISGVWKGTIQASAAGGKEKWQGPAELTLNQNGDELSGTLDDSGSPDGHTYVLFAFFTTPKEWDSIMRKWMGVVHHYGLCCFHATDCANGAAEFEGWSSGRKKRMFTSLIDILAHHSNLRACSAGIVCKD